MSGRGIPVTGIKPTTMPTLTRIWKLSTATTPITTNVPARSGAVCAFWVKRISTMKYNSRTPSAPTNPCSSANAAKMKSVCGTGRKAPCVCEPLPPHSPPEPTAILDCSTWYPDPWGSGYQVEQSKIAVGSGGLWGGKGSQTHGAFLPVPQTDFIFAAFAEEHGFVGALGVLLLYFIVLMRLTQNAQTAPDRAGTFVVMGVVAVLSFHILVNVGMVVGFMPVTGIPLPLMSYGGSSVLFMFLALGMVMNVRMRRFVN